MLVLPLLSLLIFAPAPVNMAPCVRPTRSGTQVQGEVRVCPGRYRIADANEQGVIIAAASGTRIDLTGVILESVREKENGEKINRKLIALSVESPC